MPDLLSVVMPTRNRAESARRAAASVLAQDVELELVIVDDGSDDDSAEQLEDLAASDHRVRVVHAEAAGGPLGPCVTRNLGLERARGELVSFCDDDDTWAPDAARVVLEFLDAHPEVVVAAAWHRVSHVELGTSAVFRGPGDYGTRELLWQNFVASPFAFVRRRRLPFDVSFDPALPTGEDWDLWLRCAEHGAVRTVPRCCYVYTQHGGSRVTRTLEAQVTGRRGFLSKHDAAMTPSCRLYHEAVLAGYEHGRRGIGAFLASAASRTPVQAALVGTLLGASAAAARLGQRRGDPGLQARLMVGVVRRVERRR